MTTRKPTSFTVGKGRAVAWEGSALVQVDAGFVPTLLHRLEVYKHEFPYSSAEEWAIGVDAVTRQQEQLLMDIGDRLISEVRALRNGQNTELAERDPQVDPYTLTSWTLQRLGDTTGEGLNTANNHLDNANYLLGEIKALLEAQAGGETGQLEALQQIIFLLGAA